MTHRSVVIQEMRVSLTAIKNLTEQQRYAWYVLGMIYNETMCLRKLISYCTPGKAADRRIFIREAQFSQVFFLFRIACSKVFEAKEKIHSKEVSEVLRRDLFPSWSEGQARLKEMNRMLDRATWLSNFRNDFGFHYPTPKQLKPHITPGEAWDDDFLYAAEGGGNLYLHGADSVVRSLMFSQVPGESGARQMENLVDQMVEIIVGMNSFIEHVLAHFTLSLLSEQRPLNDVGKVLAPHLYDITVPFWTHQAATGGRKRKRARA